MSNHKKKVISKSVPAPTVNKQKQFDAGKLKEYKKKNTIYILISLIVTVIVYSLSLRNGWILNWDDGGYVIEHDLVHKLSIHNIAAIFSIFYKGNYHPLTTLFYAIEYALVKDSPFLYHLNNLLFHLANVVLAYTFVRLLTKKQEIAFIVAIFFGIHPMHVESVAWISERKDVLYGFFFLGSMIYYYYYLTKKTDKRKYLIYSLIAFLLSLLSKSAAVTLPFVLLLIDYYMKRKWEWKLLTEKIPFLVLGLIFGVLAILSQHSAGAIQDLNPLFSVFERPLLACYSTMLYLIKLFAPIGLKAMYPYPNRINGLLPLYVYIIPFIIAALAFLVYYSRKFNRDIVFGGLFFIVTISLVLQLLPVGGAILAERYAYIPYIGLFIIIGKGYMFFKEDKSNISKVFKWVYPSILVAGVIIFSVMTFQRILIWKDGKILFSDLIQKSHLPFAYNNRGYFNFRYGEKYYKEKGYQNTKRMAYDSALTDYNMCILLDSTFHRALSNRGVLYYNLCENAKKDGSITDTSKLDSIYRLAVSDFTRALRLKDDNTDAWIGRANTYSTLKEFAQSLPDYNRYITLIPDSANAYLWRGIALYNVGRYDEAYNDLNKCIRMKPRYDNAYLWRGIVYYQRKDYKAAINDFNESITLNPTQEQPYSWRGLAEYGLNDNVKAIEDFTKALEMNPKDAPTFINRSSAYYNLKDYEKSFKDYCSAGDLRYPLVKEYFFKLKALAGK